MDPEEFVSNLRRATEHAATESTLGALRRPAGRQPEPQLVRLSQWFKDLNVADQDMVSAAVALATEQATYNVLLVLDGLLAIEDTRDSGHLELFHVLGTSRTRLNDPDADELSSLFKQ